MEGFQHLLALRFFEQVHRQALKPALYIPPPQLSPIRTEVSGDYLGWYSAARMVFLLVVLNAFSQLLRCLEPEGERGNSHQDDFAWGEIRGSERRESFLPDACHDG